MSMAVFIMLFTVQSKSSDTVLPAGSIKENVVQDTPHILSTPAIFSFTFFVLPVLPFLLDSEFLVLKLRQIYPKK